MDSCERAGIRLTDDFNAPGAREGAGYYHFAVREGVRDSAARSMLGDIVMGRDVRTNLDIVTGALVTKVVMDAPPPVRDGKARDSCWNEPRAQSSAPFERSDPCPLQFSVLRVICSFARVG